MGIVVTFIIIVVLYITIQVLLFIYRERYLMKLPYVYVKERRIKRKVRKDIKHLREAYRKMHTQN